MSIGGPSALGTLLVHRLDSVLGTTLSQQANLVSGARPDAVSQPGHPEKTDPSRNETHRQTRDGVDRAMAQSEQPSRQAIDRARIDARAAELLAARSAPSTSTTKSAPTSLGHAAKVILALLANFPDEAPPVQGKAPLLGGGSQRPADASNPTSPNAGASTSTSANANAAAVNAARAETAPAASRGQGNAAAPAASSATSTPGGPNAASAIAQQANSVPAQLAQALAQALQNSGIFYESHLNNLAFGKHSLSQLQQEPQAQAGRGTTSGAAPGANNSSGAPATPSSNTPGTAVAARADNPAAAAHGGRSEALGGPGSNSPASGPGANAGNSPLPVPGLDPQTHQLVRQQLEMLANQTFAWRGEAWPNAPMEWEIHRREPSKEDTDLPVEVDHWATSINIHLPTLGAVQARLTLAGQQLVMHLIAPESSALLNEHTEALRGRYSALGMQLSQFSVAGSAWEAAGSGRQSVEDSIAAMYQPRPDPINGQDSIDGSSSP